MAASWAAFLFGLRVMRLVAWCLELALNGLADWQAQRSGDLERNYR
jgi:hypothetical protein